MRVLFGLSALALLTACGGSNDGSAANPTNPPPQPVDVPTVYSALTSARSINSTGLSTGLNPNTTFRILSGPETNNDSNKLLILTTDSNLADGLEDGAELGEPPITTQGAIDQAALNSGFFSSNELNPAGISLPYGYRIDLGGGDYVQIYADHTNSNQSSFANLTVSGPEFIQLPTGNFEINGRSVIYRLDNTNSVNNNMYGAQNGSTMETGDFKMILDPSNGVGSFVSNTANSLVAANNLNVNASTGEIESNDLSITHLGVTYTGAIYGNVHGSGEAASGIFASTDLQPTVVGAFAGSR